MNRDESMTRRQYRRCFFNPRRLLCCRKSYTPAVEKNMSEFCRFFPRSIKSSPSRLFALSDGVQMAGQPRVRSQLRLSLNGTESRPVKYACSTERKGYPRLDHVYDWSLGDARRQSLVDPRMCQKGDRMQRGQEVVVLRGNEEADGE